MGDERNSLLVQSPTRTIEDVLGNLVWEGPELTIVPLEVGEEVGAGVGR